MPLYEPEEDSELLRKSVLEHAFGDVLDMGTGSGIQAFAAASREEVKSVLAVDIDEESLAFVRKELAEKKGDISEKIKVLHSDLFASVTGRFDTIIFNPPYLPNEEKDEHQALYGGKEGYELTLRFLTEAKKYVRENGIILLLFSSLTNKERVDQELKREGYHFEQVLMEAHFFERLYVYKIWRLDHGR
jgi:release factor glutamine methyltransferase